MRATETLELIASIDVLLATAPNVTPAERVRLEDARVRACDLAVSQVLSDAADHLP